MKIKIPDVPRDVDNHQHLCWKQEVNGLGNLTTFLRCTKPKGHEEAGDPLHSWEHYPDPNGVSRMR